MFTRFPLKPIKTGKRGHARRMHIGTTWPIGRVVANVMRYEREGVFKEFDDFGYAVIKKNEPSAAEKVARRIIIAEPSLRRQDEEDEAFLVRITKDVRNMLVAAAKHKDRVPRLDRDPSLIEITRGVLRKPPSKCR